MLAWGGEAEDMVEQYTPLYEAALTSIAFIYLILLFQFRATRRCWW